MSELSVSRAGWRARAVPLRLRSDDRLSSDAAKGDAAAFAALYERHHQPLYRYCRSIVGDADDAADALQSTMTRAWAAIGERDPAAPLRAWLFRIAHTESVSLLRRRRATEPLDADALVAPDVATDAERRRRLVDLVRDLEGLSERQRGALLMREVSGLGHAEIAAALGATEGAVKQSIYEARVALQDLAMGREMSCSAVQRELSDGDGRTARSRRLRGHLRACKECRVFREGLRARRSELAVIAPLLPAGTAAAVLEAVIGAGGIGGGGLLAGLLGGSAAKTVAVGAATVTAGAGAVTFTAVAPEGDRPGPRAGAAAKRDGAKAAKAAPTVPVIAEAVARPERDEPMLVSPGRSPTGGGDGRGSAPVARERDDGQGEGSAGRDRRREERDEGDDDEDSSGSGSGEAELADDSSGPGKVDLAEDSSGSGSRGGGPAEDDEPEPGEAEDDSGND